MSETGENAVAVPEEATSEAFGLVDASRSTLIHHVGTESVVEVAARGSFVSTHVSVNSRSMLFLAAEPVIWSVVDLSNRTRHHY